MSIIQEKNLSNDIAMKNESSQYQLIWEVKQPSEEALITKDGNKLTSNNSINNNNEDTKNQNNENDNINIEDNSSSADTDDYEDNYNIGRKWYEKIFSEVRPGSVRASIFSLSILCMGTGCLILPLRCAQLSLLVCFFEILICGGCAYWTLSILTDVSKKCGIMTYSNIIRHYLGSCWSNFFDICVIFYLMGVLIIYNIVSK